MNCREIRLKFSEALDAPPDGELRGAIEQHCVACEICGPEWRTLLRLETLMSEAPPVPRGFADRVMAAIPEPAPARREAMPFIAAGLLAASVLVAFQFLSSVASFGAPALDQLSQTLAGITELVRARAAENPWMLSGWIAAAAGLFGAVSGALLLKVRQSTN